MRTLRQSAMTSVEASPPLDATIGGRPTLGRWEIVLHTGECRKQPIARPSSFSAGDAKGGGGTTSNLRLVATGAQNNEPIAVDWPNEIELRSPPARSLFQCDFGASLGSLVKLRLVADGVGEQPDLFVRRVELRDLDTQARCVLSASRWLRPHSTKR